jgi:hypothetical protein
MRLARKRFGSMPMHRRSPVHPGFSPHINSSVGLLDHFPSLAHKRRMARLLPWLRFWAGVDERAV